MSNSSLATGNISSNTNNPRHSQNILSITNTCTSKNQFIEYITKQPFTLCRGNYSPKVPIVSLFYNRWRKINRSAEDAVLCRGVGPRIWGMQKRVSFLPFTLYAAAGGV